MKKINTQSGGGDTDTDNLLTNDESDICNSDNNIIENENNNTIYIKYIKAKLKYDLL